jgi:hypothetical protein
MKMPFTVAILLFFGSTAFSQEAALQPGPEHERLKQLVGTRSGQMKMWVQGPDSEPLTVPVKETNTLVHNGFWLETVFEAGPYKGSGTTGYDPIKKKYIGTWTGNMTPFLALLEGEYNQKTHEYIMYFDDYDPTGQKLVKMKSVNKEEPGKPSTFTMYQQADSGDEWVRTFVVTYEAKE